jgi:hypothetical protein
MVADGWRLAFAAFRPRTFDAFDRVMGDSVFLAQIRETLSGNQGAAWAVADMCGGRSLRRKSGQAALGTTALEVGRP